MELFPKWPTLSDRLSNFIIFPVKKYGILWKTSICTTFTRFTWDVYGISRFLVPFRQAPHPPALQFSTELVALLGQVLDGAFCSGGLAIWIGDSESGFR
jgi:hypothetical protein